jgi:orotate phosphoribosyltransferase
MNPKIFAEILLKTESVKISTNPPFTYTSGIKSPIYCDNRKLISFVEERKIIIEGFKKLIKDSGFKADYLAGTATAAIPWAAFVAYDMGLAMVYVRPKPKAHGTGKQIEGYLKEGSKVLVIEDLVSTGGSSIKTAQVLQNEGKSEVIGVLSIMTYDMPKAHSQFKEANVDLKTLTNFATLMELVKETGALTEDQYKLALEWNKDPENWFKKL